MESPKTNTAGTVSLKGSDVVAAPLYWQSVKKMTTLQKTLGNEEAGRDSSERNLIVVCS